MLWLSTADFFQNIVCGKYLSRTLSEFQIVRIQIRTDILSVLIWFQAVYKGYQQTTKDTASKKRVNSNNDIKYMKVIKKSNMHVLITLV